MIIQECWPVTCTLYGLSLTWPGDKVGCLALRGDMRGKVHSSSRVRNMWTTFVYCRVCSPETLPPIPRPKCLGDTVVKQDHVCSEVYMLCCTVMGRGVRVCGGASENDAWPEITSPQRQQSITLPFPWAPSLASMKAWKLCSQTNWDNFPTMAAIYHPTHPSLPMNTFSCLLGKPCKEVGLTSDITQGRQKTEELNFTSLFKGAFLANDPANK